MSSFNEIFVVNWFQRYAAYASVLTAEFQRGNDANAEKEFIGYAVDVMTPNDAHEILRRLHVRASSSTVDAVGIDNAIAFEKIYNGDRDFWDDNLYYIASGDPSYVGTRAKMAEWLMKLGHSNVVSIYFADRIYDAVDRRRSYFIAKKAMVDRHLVEHEYLSMIHKMMAPLNGESRLFVKSTMLAMHNVLSKTADSPIFSAGLKAQAHEIEKLLVTFKKTMSEESGFHEVHTVARALNSPDQVMSRGRLAVIDHDAQYMKLRLTVRNNPTPAELNMRARRLVLASRLVPAPLKREAANRITGGLL